jgi:hypothetical protein
MSAMSNISWRGDKIYDGTLVILVPSWPFLQSCEDIANFMMVVKLWCCSLVETENTL